MSNDCSASGQGGGCRGLRCAGALLAVVAVAGGVLLPVGITAWRHVASDGRRADAAERHEGRANEFFQKGEYLAAAQSFGLARALSSDPRFQVAEARARMAYLADHAEAIDVKASAPLRNDCDWLQVEDPEFTPVYLTVQAHIAAYEGSLDRALELYSRALDRQPTLVGARLGKGLVARKNGDNATAREALNTVVQLRPDLWDALYALADLEAASGDNGRAIDFYTKAIAVRDDARIRYGLGLAQAGRKDVKSAVESLQKAVELDPKLADAWVSLATLYLSAGALPQAEQALRGALQARPDPVVAGTLAAILNRMGRPSDALQVLTPLLRQQAGPAALIEAAKSLETLGRKEEAQSLFDAAAEGLRKIGSDADREAIEPLVREIEAARQRMGGAAPAAAPGRPAGK